MPKKQPRNAFYFFMVNFRQEQKKIGVNYEKMSEVAVAAGPLWRDAPPSVKTKYEEIAKQEKLNRNIPDHKYTSTGVPLAEIDRQEKELRDAEEAERQDIKNMVKLKCFNGAILKEFFYVFDLNWYCKTPVGYLIGEWSVARFTLAGGIIDQYHNIFNPGRIPSGYVFDVKTACQELGLNMPDEDKETSYSKSLSVIVDYLKLCEVNKRLPPLYTMPEKVEPTLNFLHQICSKSGEDENIFRVYKLDSLFYTLINGVKTRHDEGYPRESLALAQLNKDPFKYTPRLGCEEHENLDKSVECTMSRTRRWAFTILDSCCPVAGVDMKSGNHIPGDFDLDRILTFREQKRERAGPSVAASQLEAASCNTTTSDFNQSSFNESVEKPKKGNEKEKEKRTHAPLRMPKADYSQAIRPAPDLTEANFPKLSAGRGRGLGGSSSRMNTSKK